MKGTEGYVFNQTMLRIKDPEVSVPFYEEVLGMKLLGKFDFPEMDFCLFFLGYSEQKVPDHPEEKATWIFEQPALLELTHNYGTEKEVGPVYHDGNSDPRGFGHIGISVPDVYVACERFDKLGVEYVKRPDDGKMKGLAFIKDPDGYWIEILSPSGLAKITARES